MAKLAVVICLFLLLPLTSYGIDNPDPAVNQSVRIVMDDKDVIPDSYLDEPIDVTCHAPGDTIGQTTYDWWSNGPAKRLITVPSDGGPCIQVIWDASDEPKPWVMKGTKYNGYHTIMEYWVYWSGMGGGTWVNTKSGAGTIDENSRDRGSISMQTELPTDYVSSVAIDLLPCEGRFIPVHCPTAAPDTFIYPRLAIDGDGVFHVFSRSQMGRHRLEYTSSKSGWVYGSWAELDTLGYGWHNATASKQSPTVAAIYSVAGDSAWQPTDRHNSLVIYESFDSGSTFTKKTILKDLLEPTDTLNCMLWGGNGLYDGRDSIHVVTVATKPADLGEYYPLAACNLWHYTPELGLTVVSSYPWMYDPPAFDGVDGIYGNNQLIHMPSIGYDPETGYFYVLWVEFPWYEEQGGFQCGELFVRRSTDGGQTWSFKMNMTNTHNESEVYPSLAELVDGKLHIVYEQDVVAGSYVRGSSSLSFNPVKYLGYPVADGNAAALTIDSPPDAVSYGQSYTPKVTVQNRGAEPISFSVSCQADYGEYCFYMDTQPVRDLAPGATEQVSFEPWVPDTVLQGLSGTFWTCAGFVGDTNYSDDCVQKLVLVGIEEAADRKIRRLRFTLGECHPNPFSQSTSIRYEIAKAEYVSLAVYDLAGRIVNTLVDQDLSSGTYTATWNGKDSGGQLIPNGVYFYRLKSGSFTATRKTVLIR